MTVDQLKPWRPAVIAVSFETLAQWLRHEIEPVGLPSDYRIAMVATPIECPDTAYMRIESQEALDWYKPLPGEKCPHLDVSWRVR